ncbi:MAG: PEP-CTERM sorting domain-containing protein [Verrucomicrobia bacterium]|nr:PEP-CTERM sorting domain-containing protein [Verrucomicrobiota bacterium]
MKRVKLMLTLAVLSGAVFAQAAPRLGLVKSGTAAQAADSVLLGTATYTMDLRANTDGFAVGGLQYYLVTTPGNVVTYGATPLTALNNPFVAADLTGFGQPPTAGATVNSALAGTTIWFAGSDYAAFPEQSIGTYQFNVSSLGGGTYVFTPGGEELSNGNGDNPAFASPGSFALSVVPEPGSALLMGVGVLALSLRRRGQRRAA